jgi:hypothetical protein
VPQEAAGQWFGVLTASLAPSNTIDAKWRRKLRHVACAALPVDPPRSRARSFSEEAAKATAELRAIYGEAEVVVAEIHGNRQPS